MKKQELLGLLDSELTEKLYAFCYARTNDSYEAEDLCSDIVYAILKAAHADGEIENAYAFIWRIARNVYADFSAERKKRADNLYEGDPEEAFMHIPAEEEEDDTREKLLSVYRSIAFLTKAYREVTVMFYLDGLSVKEIAKLQGTSENAVRQRLFSARQQIKSEVNEMNENNSKPVALEKIDLVLWGTGSPGWGDPRNVCNRMFSNHVVYLCSKKPRTASEIAEELNVPTVYVEEELEILTNGTNGEYGILRRLDNGRYGINVVLLDKDAFGQATEIYKKHIPKICDTIYDFVNEHKEEYLSFPYINKKTDMNLILWQQISSISYAFEDCVVKYLKENHFKGFEKPDRPFTVFGYVDNGVRYGGGWDGATAQNICGYSEVRFDNIYITRIAKHFDCFVNISKDPLLQLAIRALYGLDVASLSDKEKEHAAKAIKCGYLYREGDMIYTKLLTTTVSDRERLFGISEKLREGYFEAEAEKVAAELAALIKKNIPEYLWNEWSFANTLANMPILDSAVESLIEKGMLTPPEDGVGAEGCWMSVEK